MPSPPRTKAKSPITKSRRKYSDQLFAEHLMPGLQSPMNSLTRVEQDRLQVKMYRLQLKLIKKYQSDNKEREERADRTIANIARRIQELLDIPGVKE